MAAGMQSTVVRSVNTLKQAVDYVLTLMWCDAVDVHRVCDVIQRDVDYWNLKFNTNDFDIVMDLADAYYSMVTGSSDTSSFLCNLSEWIEAEKKIAQVSKNDKVYVPDFQVDKICTLHEFDEYVFHRLMTCKPFELDSLVEQMKNVAEQLNIKFNTDKFSSVSDSFEASCNIAKGDAALTDLQDWFDMMSAYQEECDQGEVFDV